MNATVGGRLETVERKRSLFGPDYLRLAALALVAVAVHAWLINHTALTARDSLGFARQALCFQTPGNAPPHPDGRPQTAIDLVRAAEQPPGYPLAICAADKLVRQVSHRTLPDRALLSAQVANSIAAVLLVVPSYLIGRMLFGRNVAFAAALLFQVLPVPARITSDGLSEGVYLLVTGVAIMLAVRAVRRPGIAGFLLCGLAVGMSYLVRPEGLMVAAGPGAVALWLGLTRRWPRDVALARLTALGVGVALVATPYMALIGKLSNKPTSGELDPFAPPRPIYHGLQNTQRATAGGPLFAEWWNDEQDSGKSQTVWAVGAVLKETSKSGHHVVWPLAVFAVVALRRRFAAEPGLWVLAVLAACNFLLLIYLAARVGYVSERHTVLLTLLACQLAAAGLPLLAAALGELVPRLGQRLGVRVTAAGLLVALVASALPFALKPMHPNREGHKHAGNWLAANLTPRDAVVDPFCWAEWYSGRTLYRVPHGHNPKESRNTYVILEDPNGTPHSRLPVLQTAKDLAAQGRVVYHWPENVPVERAEVLVYKLGPD